MSYCYFNDAKFMKNNIFAVNRRTADLIKFARETNRMISDIYEENE